MLASPCRLAKLGLAKLGRSATASAGALSMAAALAAAAAPALASNAASFNELVTTFRQYGFEVVSTHQRCLTERNLFGLYLRGTRRIVVCPRGNQLDTLMHEGWHAVQARCRKGAPLLSNAYLRANLSRADLRDIDALYSAKSWHREAEARAMAAQKMPLYLAHLESSCGKPALPGGIAQPPSAAPAPGSTAVPAAAPAAPATPLSDSRSPSLRPTAPAPASAGSTALPAAVLQQLLPSLLP